MAKKSPTPAGSRAGGRKQSSSASKSAAGGRTTHRSEAGERPARSRKPAPAVEEVEQQSPEAPQESARLASAAEAVGRMLGRTAATIADLMPGGSSDGLDLLERDHRRLQSLLSAANDTSEGDDEKRTELLQTITKELKAHELIEEKILYPALKKHAEAKDIVLEGYQEHHVADVLLRELQALPTSDERWGAKMKVLKESLDHHIEEEEGDMFKTARSIVPREQLDELGARMQALKAEAMNASD